MRPVTKNQIEVALGRQLTQFREKENFDKLIRLFIQEFQDIENVQFDLLNERSIFTAVGRQLDLIGLLLGENRMGRNDDQYRAALLLRVAINIADGTPDTILDITQTYTTAQSVDIWEHYPAMVVVRTDGENRIDGSLKNLVESIKPAATKTVVVSDITRREFIPAWEVHGSEVEQFQVLFGNTQENFQVLEGGLQRDFKVVFGQVDFDNPNTDRAILAWIEPEPFCLHDGENLLLSTGDIFQVVSSAVPTDISQQNLQANGDQVVDENGNPISMDMRIFTSRGILSQVVESTTTQGA